MNERANNIATDDEFLHKMDTNKQMSLLKSYKDLYFHFTRM